MYLIVISKDAVVFQTICFGEFENRNMSTAAEIDATQPAAAECNNVRWIHDVLIPRLAAEGKLRDEAQSNVVQHVDVQQLSIGDTFMLTLCYKIRVTLAAANGFDDDDALLQLVVKVCVVCERYTTICIV